MNERIKQLAEQAGLKSEIMLDDSSRDVECFVAQYDGSTPSIHYWEKFADMIVRECADILMKPEYAMNHPEELGDYNKGWVNGRLLGIEHIKEHFGVEE